MARGEVGAAPQELQVRTPMGAQRQKRRSERQGRAV